MQIEQLEAFMYAAAAESFTKAGEMLFTSQPAVSIKIKKLEQEIGVPLFERSGTDIYLSEAGKTFLPYAQEITKNLHEGISMVHKTNNFSADEISIGAVFSSVNHLLPALMLEFSKENTNIKPIIYTGHSNQILSMVEENEVSLGIVRSLLHSNVDSFPLMKDTLVLACHPESPLSSVEKINIDEVAEFPFILFKHDTFDWALIDNAFKKAKVKPNIVMEVDSIEGVKQMVMKNIGISFLPYFSIANEVASKQLYTIQIENFPEIQRNFDLIFNPEHFLNDSTRKLMEFLKGKFS